MAVISYLERYKEVPTFSQHATLGGGFMQTQGYHDIMPAKFCVVSGSQTELQEIAMWVSSNDIKGAISVSDSVDGLNHMFTVTMYDKEAIVLFMLIWE